MYGRCFFWVVFCLLSFPPTFGLRAQSDPQPTPFSGDVFSRTLPLELWLTASIKSLKRDTNDSIYLESTLRFAEKDELPDSVNLQIRARGDFRKTHCYFAPMKLTFQNSEVSGTLFEGHKELKLVLPCLIGSFADDYVLKEYLAYKLFETVSRYHYRTRLVNMHFTEKKGRRERQHEQIGFLIEDHGSLARRLQGQRYREDLPAQMQDPRATVVNNLFQYAIGNTDFSLRLQHNQRLYYIEGKYVSVPYDFDMSGLVDAPYAEVSNVQTLDYQPSTVTERAYKGYMRDTALLQEVRREFLGAEPEMMRQLELLQPYFSDRKQYEQARDYLLSFFAILKDDRKFEREILRRMRG